MKKNRNEKRLVLNKLNVARLNNPDLIKGGSQMVAILDDGTDTGGNGPDAPPPPPRCITSVIPVNPRG
ncbi:hypothetical protein [uncultured Aquimarina sp.]|uniref:hypothetical protein n=1 Tax=uncultured Aquimarina sp. TaxID=575652 RepID=UPI00260ABBA3|nr:hypothetical protein [uncultured Aquimarina sp.]